MSDDVTRISLAAVPDNDRTDWARVARLDDAAITTAMAADPDSIGVDAEPGEVGALRYELYSDDTRTWRWRLVARDDRVVAMSGGDFASREAARAAIDEMRRAATKAEVRAA